MRATIVHNPKAGSGRSIKKVMSALADAGYGVTYCSVKEEDFPDHLRRATDLIIAAGGDGTIGRVLTELPDRETPTAILPLGTANNIARSLGIEGDLKDIIASWKKAKERLLDIGVAKGPFGERRFVEAVGIGALVEATMRKDKSNARPAVKVKRGRTWFWKALAKAKPYPVEIRVDERTIESEALLVEIMNVDRVGPGLILAQDADPTDGLLDVILIPPDRRKAMLEWVAAEDYDKPAPVLAEQGKRVSIALNGVPFRIGDKFPPATSETGGVAVEVEAGRVKVLIPS